MPQKSIVYLQTLLFFILSSYTHLIVAQGSVCEDKMGDNGADPFCSDVGVVFPNCNLQNLDCTPSAETTGVIRDYSCLEEQPFPAWYYLRIKDPGKLVLNIKQTSNEDGTGDELDVDFICYGPFSDPVTPCQSQLAFGNIISCSYSPDASETMTLFNAKYGEYYLVMITNFSGQPGYISFQQVEGEGATDCSILGVLLGPDQNICGTDPIEIDSTSDEAVSYEWSVLNETNMMFEVIPGETNPTIIISSSGTYQLLVEDIDGNVETDEIVVTFNEKPLVNSNVSDHIECATSVMNKNEAIFDLTSNDEKVSAAVNSSNVSVVYYENESDFSQNKPISKGNAVAFKNVSNPQVIYASVVDKNIDCKSDAVTSFSLKVEPLPFINNAESLQGVRKVCVSQDGRLLNSLLLGEDIGSVDGELYRYDWTPDNQDLDGDNNEDAIFVIDELLEETTYTLSVTRVNSSGVGVNCENNINPETGEEYKIVIKPTATPLEVEYKIESESFSEYYTVSVIPKFSIGELSDFEYRLDDGAFQDSPAFTGLRPGDYIVSARNKFGCLPEVQSDVIELLGYPKYFTPNEDGFHDTWSLINMENQPNAQIHIFDRYGKLLKQLTAGGVGWDGTYNGTNMPSSEYWFRVEFNEPGDPNMRRRVFTGSFSLIR